MDYGYISGNAIVEVEYNSGDAMAAGFPTDDYAFVYRSVWFTELGGLDETAWIGDGDFLVSGFWEEWETSGADGAPIVVHGQYGDANVALIGLNNTFRGHPENTFRLLGNAIFNGLN